MSLPKAVGPADSQLIAFDAITKPMALIKSLCIKREFDSGLFYSPTQRRGAEKVVVSVRERGIANLREGVDAIAPLIELTNLRNPRVGPMGIIVRCIVDGDGEAKV